jgi:hypothetical protein
MQKLIQIHPCLLKLSRKQESVTDGRPLLLYPSPLPQGDNKSTDILFSVHDETRLGENLSFWLKNHQF